jgi:ribosomal RNA-processing protein 12
VLDVLPLGLGPALDGVRGAPDPRTWVLPALRVGVRGARLSHWCTHLMPLARDMGGRSGAAAAAGDRVRALQTRALELQVWQALPAFANWAVDGGDALR